MRAVTSPAAMAISQIASFLRSAKGLSCRSRARPPAALIHSRLPVAHPHAFSRHAPHHASRHHVPQSLHIMTPPSPPASTGQRRASGERFGEFEVRWLALPPVGSGLKRNLFAVRPLFRLTPAPPRRLWSLSVFCQKPLPNSSQRSVPGWSVRRVLAVVDPPVPTLRRHGL